MAKHISLEFKREAIQLLPNHHYTLVEAAGTINVTLSAITHCINKLRDKRTGMKSKGIPPTLEQLELREIEKEMPRLNM
ncbi:hypothetical protein R84981_000339 [Carnimonas sp. R-84981]|uniref:hypothetical protein n=1 Tax=Carnimonas bestiolae TaxID=3402172 RepID=UPI003EDBD5D1